jgi:starch synthase (maltosyl-transferring)
MQGPRIYNLFPLLAGPLGRWTPHLERAAAMGFNWIFVNPVHQAGLSGSLYAVKDYYTIDARLLEGNGHPLARLREAVQQVERLGLALMLDLVINHTAVDSLLVTRHPRWFKRGPRGALVHPGAKHGDEEVIWGDLAEVDNAGSPDREALWAYWRDLALFLTGLGVTGFRCDAAYQVPAELWRYLIGAVKARHPEVRFFAETLGCTPKEALRTAQAGFDFIFNSGKWWDLRAPWFLEQYALLSPVVPSVGFPESHDTGRLAADMPGDAAGVLQRYALAALLTAGVMIPIGFEYGFRKPLHVVETTPSDWEPPAWDLTGPIGAINRAKAARRPLNEEGPLTPVDLADERLFAFEKATRDGRERLLAVLNLERARSVPASIAAWRPAGSARIALDPVTGASQPVQDGRLLLPPAAVRLVHPA